MQHTANRQKKSRYTHHCKDQEHLDQSSFFQPRITEKWYQYNKKRLVIVNEDLKFWESTRKNAKPLRTVQRKHMTARRIRRAAETHRPWRGARTTKKLIN